MFEMSSIPKSITLDKKQNKPTKSCDQHTKNLPYYLITVAYKIYSRIKLTTHPQFETNNSLIKIQTKQPLHVA